MSTPVTPDNSYFFLMFSSHRKCVPLPGVSLFKRRAIRIRSCQRLPSKPNSLADSLMINCSTNWMESCKVVQVAGKGLLGKLALPRTPPLLLQAVVILGAVVLYRASNE